MDADVLVHELHDHVLDPAILRQQWHVDAPWQSSGLLEAPTIQLGQLIYRQAMQREAQLYGLRPARRRIDGFNLAWLSNRPSSRHRGTIVMLHGISSEKSHWLRFARYLTRDYRLILLDLPAHGQTGYEEGRDYSTLAQAKRILQLMDVLHIQQAHLVGNSMGGFIAQRLALIAPLRVASLALFDAAGLQARHNSALEQSLRSEHNPFIVHSLAEFNTLMAMAAKKWPWIPSQVRLMLAKQYHERSARWFDVFTQVMLEIYPSSWVEAEISRLKMPTLVLWGELDALLDIDMLHHYSELLPHAQIVSMPNTGHMPMIERPARTAHHYSEFLKNNFSLKRLAHRTPL